MQDGAEERAPSAELASAIAAQVTGCLPETVSRFHEVKFTSRQPASCASEAPPLTRACRVCSIDWVRNADTPCKQLSCRRDTLVLPASIETVPWSKRRANCSDTANHNQRGSGQDDEAAIKQSATSINCPMFVVC